MISREINNLIKSFVRFITESTSLYQLFNFTYFYYDMGKKRVAAAYIFGTKYKELSQIKIIEELTDPPQCAFQISSIIGEHGKLTPRDVYNKILKKEFLLSHPEKTKTSRASIAKC